MTSISNMDNKDVSYGVSDPKLENQDKRKDILPEEIEDEPEVDIKGFLDTCLYWKWGGRTLLHLAAEKGRLDIVKNIVKKGANVNKKDDDGWSPLAYASWTGHLEIVEYLVSQNAIINDFDVERCTPIMRATEAGHTDVVEYLSCPKFHQTLNIIESHF